MKPDHHPPSPQDFADAVPPLEGSVSIEGIDARLEICRDRFGIPHIRAGSAHDGFVGQGFAAAADRLWQMDSDRRKASGRWASVVGPSAVASDVFVRRLGLEAAARRDLAGLAVDTQEMLEAYAAGVNAFLGFTDARPIECALTGADVERWEPWNSLAVYKFRHLYMGTFHRKIWRATMAKVHGIEGLRRLIDPVVHHLVVPPGERYEMAVDLAAELAGGAEALAGIPDTDGASNNWALGPARTATGLPLVAGDPHRGLDLPNVYHQNHITGGDIDVIGLSFPGVPAFPHFGHNQHVAWCITHAMADDQDVFVERLSDEGTVVSRRTERIEVRGGDPVDAEVLVTVNGPVVVADDDETVGLSLAWTALAGHDSTFDALGPMLRAGSSAALNEACRPWVIPGNNLVTGDTSGSIGYKFRGRLPRRHAANGWLPVPGWDPAYRWRDHVPFDELPELTNPQEGFVFSANQRVSADLYVSNDYASPARAERLAMLLAQTDNATAETCSEILADVVSLPARRFVARLSEMDPTPELEPMVALLEHWDGRLAADSSAAALYVATREAVTVSVIEALGLGSGEVGVLGELATAAERAHQSWRVAWEAVLRNDDRDVSDLGGWDHLLAQALLQARAELISRFDENPESWSYGRLRRTRMWWPLEVDASWLADSLPVPETEVAGDGDTIRAARVLPGTDYRAQHGSVARYVFDLADWERSGWTAVHGVSGHPGSTHFADQLDAWSKVELVPMPYSAAAVDDHTEQVLSLVPIGR